MSSRAPGHHGYQRASGRLRFASTVDINSSHRCRSRRRERAVCADRASEPAHLREIIRDGSSVRHLTKGNHSRCHDLPAWGKKVRGGGSMPILLSDLLLFSCLALLITGMVIVVGSLLI